LLNYGNEEIEAQYAVTLKRMKTEVFIFAVSLVILLFGQ